MIPIMPDARTHPEEISIRGSVLVLLQFDVSEAISLEDLRTLMPSRGPSHTLDQPPDKHPTAAHIRSTRAWVWT